MTPVTSARRFPLARPATAWLLGGLLLALAITAVPLAAARTSLEPAHVSVWVGGGQR